MKKQITYGLVVMVLLGTTVANAQIAPTSPAVPVAAPAFINATTAAPVDAKAAKKVKLQEAATKLENSLQVRIANLDDIAVRMQTRIGKMQQEGKDVTAATAALSNAQKAIAAAKTDLATLEKRIATMVASKTPSASFAIVQRSVTLGVVVKIKAAHKALVDTLVIMKGQGMPKTMMPAATSSTSTVK